jgi:hypothetical protein
VYPFADYTEQTDLRELKRLAMIRRTDKLMDWLGRPEYARYEDINSTDHLLKLTDLVIYALELSLPENEWKPFLRALKKVKHTVLGYTDDEASEPEPKIDDAANYYLGTAALLETLKKYRQHIDQ